MRLDPKKNKKIKKKNRTPPLALLKHPLFSQKSLVSPPEGCVFSGGCVSLSVEFVFERCFRILFIVQNGIFIKKKKKRNTNNVFRCTSRLKKGELHLPSSPFFNMTRAAASPHPLFRLPPVFIFCTGNHRNISSGAHLAAPLTAQTC